MKRISTMLFATMLMLAMSVTAFAQIQLIGEIEVGLNDNNELFVNLNTGDPSMASVEYGIDGDFNQTAQQTSLTGDHTVTIGGLEVDTTYIVRAHVSDWSGNTLVSNDIPFQTPSLVSPDDVKAATRDGQARLSWSPVFGGAEYVVERADAANGPFETLATVAETNYADNTVTTEAEYFYRVSAIDAAGNQADASDVLAVVIEPALVDTDFSTDLDMDFWAMHEHNPTAKVEVSNGRLVMSNFSQGDDVRTAGIVTQDAIDFTGVKTIVEVGYSEIGIQEFNIGFADKIVGNDDPWWHNGFRLTGNPGGMNLTKFNGHRDRNDADTSFSPGWNTSVNYPADVRLEFTHTGGNNFAITVFIDGAERHQGSMSFGSLNPENMHIYFYGSTGGDDGLAAFDYVKIYQE